jgi:SAM-dependent methyltransferase
MRFQSPQQSHAHSLQTLELLYEYDDYMESISTMCDMGCGTGLDLEWWATRTTRDDNPRPLDIHCTGVDLNSRLDLKQQYRNMRFQKRDFENLGEEFDRRFDVIWCHDAWQYVIDPFQTLRHWWDHMNPDGMLVLIVPQSTNIEYNTQVFDQLDYCYYNWTLVSLMHMLATSGFDCSTGHFLKNPEDPWIHAAVYRSTNSPRDPRTTRWYDLVDAGMLPESAAASIRRHGYLRQRDLVLTWLDRHARSYANH